MHFSNTHAESAMKDRLCVSCFSFLVALLVFAAATLAQDVGTVRGEVLDAHTGEPLANANVILVGTTQGTVTDTEGRFTMDRVPVGEYLLQATHVG